MKIKFIKPVLLELCVGIHNDVPQMETEKFVVNEIVEVEICDELAIPFAREIQFSDGSIAFVNYEFWSNVEVSM